MRVLYWVNVSESYIGLMFLRVLAVKRLLLLLYEIWKTVVFVDTKYNIYSKESRQSVFSVGPHQRHRLSLQYWGNLLTEAPQTMPYWHCCRIGSPLAGVWLPKNLHWYPSKGFIQHFIIRYLNTLWAQELTASTIELNSGVRLYLAKTA